MCLHSPSRLDSAQLGSAWPSSAWFRWVWLGPTRFGLARVWPGLNLTLVSWAWFGFAPLGSAQHASPQPGFGLAQPGLAHIGSACLDSTWYEDVPRKIPFVPDEWLQKKKCRIGNTVKRQLFWLEFRLVGLRGKEYLRWDCLELSQPGWAPLGSARLGTARPGSQRPCSAQLGQAWLGPRTNPNPISIGLA